MTIYRNYILVPGDLLVHRGTLKTRAYIPSGYGLLDTGDIIMFIEKTLDTISTRYYYHFLFEETRISVKETDVYKDFVLLGGDSNK